MSAPVLALESVSKRYPGTPPIEALRDVNLRIRSGELLAIVGPSGSGKSTLLHIMGTLDRPSAGTVRVAGHEVAALSDRRLAALRARHIGFVFQQFFLLDGMSAADNVAQGLLYAGIPAAERRRRAADQLRRVGLGHRIGHRPTQLSGGERQRVTIARSLVNNPAIVWADEPTGDLDRKTGNGILDLLDELNRQHRKTVVMVTHDPHAAERASRQLHMVDGQLSSEMAA